MFRCKTDGSFDTSSGDDEIAIAAVSPDGYDQDGHGRHDVAVYRKGIWYLLESSAGMRIVPWGNPGDIPVAVRYDE